VAQPYAAQSQCRGITNALRSGMSPILVPKIAGVRSMRMIERVYSHLINDDAYDAMMVMLRTSRDR
jgi:hypothetical protein